MNPLIHSILYTDTGLAAVISALATVAAVVIAHRLQGRVNLIAFSPNSAFFQLQQQGGTPVPVRSGQVMIQNLGRKPARSVQITTGANGEPAGYSIIPTIVHSTELTGNNEWVVEIPFIAPKETITLQILNGPNVEAIRSEEGVARYVPVAHQRVFPKWLNVLIISLMLWGALSLFFIVARWLINI